jgi:hypothetical protein
VSVNVDRLRQRLLRRPAPETDPLVTLELQSRLSRLSAELRDLQLRDDRRFALGHHARAVTIAYTQSLAEACELAGLPGPENRGPVALLLAEAQLRDAGWNW